MGADPPIYSSVQGPAKWAAVVVLSAACGSGLTYSLMRQPREAPAPAARAEPSQARPTVQPLPQPLAAAPPAPAETPQAPPADAPPSPTAELVGPVAVEVTPAPAAPIAPAPEPIPPPAVLDGRVNINRATAAELELLPEIGPALAKRIIDYRTLYGPFRSITDLDKVNGIGPRTLEKLAPLVTVGG